MASEEAGPSDQNELAEVPIETTTTISQTEIRTYKEHIKNVLALTGPIIVSEVFQNTLPVMDIAFVGNLPDKNDLAAAALATVWFNLWNAAMLGFNTSIDTFLSQAYGANELKGYGLWTATGLVIVMVVTVVLSGLLAICGPAMRLFGQDETLADRAGEFSYRLIPGLFPYYAFKVLVKYLQSQNIVMPGVWVGLWANGVNILFNWALIYKLDMGLNGAPWATSITRFVEFVTIAGYIWWNRNTEQLKSTWPTLSRDLWNFEAVGPFLKLALSGSLSMAAEAWSFEIATILAGLIGTVELGAHVITLSIATFIFLSFPFAVGIAASIRVGQWIGDGSPENAQRSSLVSCLLSISIQTVLAIVLLSSKDWLANTFSSDEDVADTIAKLLPISCIFMMGDAVQATVGGVMRGLGRQRLVLALNILAFWILALPVGCLLTFVGNSGIAGIWWGYVIGIFASGILGFSWLKFRISWEKEAQKAVKRMSTLSTLHFDQSATTNPARLEDSVEVIKTTVEEPQLDGVIPDSMAQS